MDDGDFVERAEHLMIKDRRTILKYFDKALDIGEMQTCEIFHQHLGMFDRC